MPPYLVLVRPAFYPTPYTVYGCCTFALFVWVSRASSRQRPTIVAVVEHLAVNPVADTSACTAHTFGGGGTAGGAILLYYAAHLVPCIPLPLTHTTATAFCANHTSLPLWVPPTPFYDPTDFLNLFVLLPSHHVHAIGTFTSHLVVFMPLFINY